MEELDEGPIPDYGFIQSLENDMRKNGVFFGNDFKKFLSLTSIGEAESSIRASRWWCRFQTRGLPPPRCQCFASRDRAGPDNAWKVPPGRCCFSRHRGILPWLLGCNTFWSLQIQRGRNLSSQPERFSLRMTFHKSAETHTIHIEINKARKWRRAFLLQVQLSGNPFRNSGFGMTSPGIIPESGFWIFVQEIRKLMYHTLS